VDPLDHPIGTFSRRGRSCASPPSPVPAFVVAARAELEAAGIELLDEITWSRRIEGLGWFHFRGPDGCVYGMMQGSRVIDD
jgi:hypothetical protein